MARDPEGNFVSPKLRADQQEVNSLYKQLPTHAEEGKQELDRLFASGHERRDAGQTAEARERFVAAYLLARELTFGGGEAEALTLAATCTLELGELPLGVEQMEGSRKLHAKLGNADGEAEAQCNLGLAHAALGDLQRAQHAYRQSLRLARHQPLRLTTLGHLGTLLLRRGRTAEAQQVLSQALALALALGDVASERAEWLAGQAVEDGSAESSLLMQVLRQRRAQHLLMDDADMARECEQRIDALVKDSVD